MESVTTLGTLRLRGSCVSMVHVVNVLVDGQGESRDWRKRLRDSANRSGLDMPTVKDEIDRLLELSEAELLADIKARARARATADAIVRACGSPVADDWIDEVVQKSVMINDLRAQGGAK
jgi:hypothetical protein